MGFRVVAHCEGLVGGVRGTNTRTAPKAAHNLCARVLPPSCVHLAEHVAHSVVVVVGLGAGHTQVLRTTTTVPIPHFTLSLSFCVVSYHQTPGSGLRSVPSPHSTAPSPSHQAELHYRGIHHPKAHHPTSTPAAHEPPKPHTTAPPAQPGPLSPKKPSIKDNPNTAFPVSVLSPISGSAPSLLESAGTDVNDFRYDDNNLLTQLTTAMNENASLRIKLESMSGEIS